MASAPVDVAPNKGEFMALILHSHTEVFLLVDPTGKPLGPILGWQDQRTAARCVELLGEGFFVIPNTAIERQLGSIWCQVLGLEQVGVHDNFFEIGGASILSIQVVSRANNTIRSCGTIWSTVAYMRSGYRTFRPRSRNI